MGRRNIRAHHHVDKQNDWFVFRRFCSLFLIEPEQAAFDSDSRPRDDNDNEVLWLERWDWNQLHFHHLLLRFWPADNEVHRRSKMSDALHFPVEWLDGFGQQNPSFVPVRRQNSSYSYQYHHRPLEKNKFRLLISDDEFWLICSILVNKFWLLIWLKNENGDCRRHCARCQCVATCDQNQHIPLALIPSVFVVVVSAFLLPMTM